MRTLQRPRIDQRAVAAARIVLAGLAMLFAFTALYVAAFHAPRASGYDVAVVGTPAQARSIQTALDRDERGAFDVRRYATKPAARGALLRTTVHGVIVPGPFRDQVLVAQALGAGPTEIVVAALRRVAAVSGVPAAVRDLRPLPSSDRRGLSSLFTVIGTLIPSLGFGLLVAMLGRGLPGRMRWGTVVAYAVLAGVVVAFNVDVLVGALEGHFVGIAVVSALFALAVSATAHGLVRVSGRQGIAIAALLLMLLGISSAGGAVTYQFEPGFYGAISQLLPPGAALTAVRNIQYFDWAQTLAPLLVLGAWGLGGLALGVLGDRYGIRARTAASTGVVAPVPSIST